MYMANGYYSTPQPTYCTYEYVRGVPGMRGGRRKNIKTENTSKKTGGHGQCGDILK